MGTDVGYAADFSRDEGPDRDAPYSVYHPHFTRNTQTILLPPGFKEFANSGGTDVEQTVAGIEYRRSTKLARNVLTIETSQRSVAAEFPAAEAPAAQKLLRDLADRAVFVVAPRNYQATRQEVDKVLATAPTTAWEFNERGHRLVDRGQIRRGDRGLRSRART